MKDEHISLTADLTCLNKRLIVCTGLNCSLKVLKIIKEGGVYSMEENVQGKPAATLGQNIIEADNAG